MKLKISLFLLIPILAQGQWEESYLSPAEPPRFMTGGHLSTFRISLQNFENVYADRWGPSYGGFVGVRAFGAHYITFKYGQFQKGGKEGIHEPSGEDLTNALWQQHWYKLGLRIHPMPEHKLGSYYGFGIGLFNTKEAEPISVFETIVESDEKKANVGTGIYLELGIDYFFTEKVAAFFDLEVSSGGTRGRSTFEAMSIGGWLLSIGISYYPF